uniref:Uncharacterized protein n=1 Tax=uncultured marine group II/III euryarchaeote SAT1000_53_H10 TaxID=1456590 RepID=A0A075IAF0_9EURY|nr:hypothetical protein [uncultured marine group II/III euryarchaeote SAT1000_53_H10]
MLRKETHQRSSLPGGGCLGSLVSYGSTMTSPPTPDTTNSPTDPRKYVVLRAFSSSSSPHNTGSGDSMVLRTSSLYSMSHSRSCSLTASSCSCIRSIVIGNRSKAHPIRTRPIFRSLSN